MDKIKNLLEKAGVSAELSTKIVESLLNYKNTLREQLENEYAQKVNQVKKVCIDETETHKRELARRVQIFCETKGTAIENHLAKQAAISESEATAKLKNIKALLEGIQLNGKQNGSTTAASGKAQKQLQIAVEQRNKAVETANRQTAIAEKALKANRRLVTENTQLKNTVQTITESKPRPTQRLDTGRKPARKPVTTRPTIIENQERRPQPQQRLRPQTTTSGFGIADIASQVDEDLV